MQSATNEGCGIRNTPDGEAVVQLADEHGPVDPMTFSSTSTFANIVEPEIRRIAGFNDPMGAGTYTEAPDPMAHHWFHELLGLFYEEASVEVSG